MVIGIGGLTCI